MSAPPFSFSLVDEYRVTPRPRWGYGAPPHPRLAALLETRRAEYERLLNEVNAYRDLLRAIPREADPGAPAAPYWNNPFFSTLDAAMLVTLLLSRKPKRYLEIGSGHSTMFAHHAIAHGALGARIMSIDPNPRAEIDALCHALLRAPLEQVALDLFDELEAGDILFFDGSHRVFQNSDVTAFFLDVLPRLKPGVLVHIHDIFLPYDYPPAWERWLFSEQYMLAAMLLAHPPLRVIAPNHFICKDEALGARARAILGDDIALEYANPGATLACSFWLETLAIGSHLNV